MDLLQKLWTSSEEEASQKKRCSNEESIKETLKCTKKIHDFIHALHTDVIFNEQKKKRKKKETGSGWGSRQRREEGCQEDRNKGGKPEELDLKEQRKESEGHLHHPSLIPISFFKLPETHQQRGLASTRPSSPPPWPPLLKLPFCLLLSERSDDRIHLISQSSCEASSFSHPPPLKPYRQSH